jgi:hypothetical protein
MISSRSRHVSAMPRILHFEVLVANSIRRGAAEGVEVLRKGPARWAKGCSSGASVGVDDGGQVLQGVADGLVSTVNDYYTHAISPTAGFHSRDTFLSSSRSLQCCFQLENSGHMQDMLERRRSAAQAVCSEKTRPSGCS